MERPLARIEEPVAQVDRPFDYFINTLRLREPVSLTHFESATGVALAAIEPVLSQLQQKQWIEWNGDQFSTTDSGYLYLNELLSYWLADDD
jgi:oxygen-independent coproporphyrinogen-3 oxidase